MRSQHSQLGKEEARLGAQVVCFGGRADLDPAAGAPSFLPWAVWTWSFSGAARERETGILFWVGCLLSRSLSGRNARGQRVQGQEEAA